MISGFSLDPQLARDTTTIGDLPLSRLLLNEDANYPWLILVPRLPAIEELIDLDELSRAHLMEEIALTSRALKSLTRCDKLNVASFGNVVRQLHVHVMARFRTDPAGANPVWNVVPRKAYEANAREKLIAALRAGLQLKAVQG